MKDCTKCGVAKDVSEFCAMAKAPDGRHYWCRACRTLYAKRWRKRHPGRATAAVDRMRSKYPERQAARTAIDRLVRLGAISPARHHSCADCGNRAAQYDHARGYLPPHDVYVEPVCNKCHGLRDRARGEHSHGRRKVSLPMLDGVQHAEWP